jgi:MFS family permease
MRLLIRSLLSPLLSLILMNLACGLFNTFVSIRLDLQGVSPEAIGIVSASLYVGVLIGSVVLSRWISRVGHVTAFTLFCAASALITLGHMVWVDPWFWSILRIISGVCLAGVFIVVESWFLLQSPPDQRGGALSIYLGVFYLALSAGQFLINFSSPTTQIPFCITAVLLFSSILPIKMIKGCSAPKLETHPEQISLKEMFLLSPLGFFGAVVSGMVLGTVYGLAPVYGAAGGMDVFRIGMFMAVLIFGGLSFQWPMGRWADRTGRRKILALASFGASVFSIAVGMVHVEAFLPLLLLVWIFGGFSFTIYPLSMAYMCEGVPEKKIVSATGKFVLAYGIGAILGPVIAPLFMSWLGGAGLFFFIAAILFGLGLSAVRPRASSSN